ncbi:MAG TPA: alpha/beta hydrolase [Solirubrobacteraceae bacterium]|nr:alpha/beta hydrolase [Solirubrobacteraceae bacterium]
MDSLPPLLLIHGFTDTARTWDPLIPHLGRHHRVLAPTLLGHHGGPPIPPGMRDPHAAMADELERELDAAGIAALPVVGNSLGGWLAFELAARGRATCVVALSPAHGWPEDVPPASTRRQFARAQKLAGVGARHAEAIVRRPLIRWLAFADVIAHGERVPPSTAAELIRGAADCPMYEPYIAFIERGGYRAGWDDLGVPTVIAWGTQDRTIPLARSSGWFREALPDARWVTLPGCGHLPHHDDPELVASVVLEVTRAAPARLQTAAA